MDFSQLGQLGVAGLAVWLMYKIAANHIHHNTEILGQLKDVIIDLKSFLESNKMKGEKGDRGPRGR